MAVIVSMLRGVNLASHNRVKMEALRALYESLGFKTRNLRSERQRRFPDQGAISALAKRIESAIERSFGFRPAVIVRTTSELRGAIARNPFRSRRGIDPSKLLVTFLASDPAAEALEQVLKIKADPEEVHIDGREVYIYFPNGMARPKMSWVTIEKKLKDVWNREKLEQRYQAAGDCGAARAKRRS